MNPRQAGWTGLPKGHQPWTLDHHHTPALEPALEGAARRAGRRSRHDDRADAAARRRAPAPTPSPSRICTPDDPGPQRGPDAVRLGCERHAARRGHRRRQRPSWTRSGSASPSRPSSAAAAGSSGRTADKDEGHLHTSTEPNTSGSRSTVRGRPARLDLPAATTRGACRRPTRRCGSSPPRRAASRRTSCPRSRASSRARSTSTPRRSEVAINSTSLVSRDDGLFLTVKGHVWNDILVLPERRRQLHLQGAAAPRPVRPTRSTTHVGGLRRLRPWRPRARGEQPADNVQIWLGRRRGADFRSRCRPRRPRRSTTPSPPTTTSAGSPRLGYSFTARRVTTSTDGRRHRRRLLPTRELTDAQHRPPQPRLTHTETTTMSHTTPSSRPGRPHGPVHASPGAAGGSATAALATVAMAAGLVPVALSSSAAGAINNCPVPQLVGCPDPPTRRPAAPTAAASRALAGERADAACRTPAVTGRSRPPATGCSCR